MLKNIQKKLLLNHPLIWNIRLIPVLLGAVLGNILLFLLGYSIQKSDFTDYYSSYSESFFLIYFFITIVVVLSIILWLVNYSKNNAVKSFYPKKSSNLYLEWILILVSVFSIVLFPFSFDRGTNYKLRSYATINEINHAENILSRVIILMPSSGSKMNYFQEKPTEETSHNNRYSVKSRNEDIRYDYYSNRVDSIFEDNQQVYYPDYPNFSQFSLLNYSTVDRIMFINPRGREYQYKGSYEIVKEWLVDAKTDSIKHLMNEYLELESRNHFRSNITVDQWFSRVYNPPTFRVKESALFDMPYYYYDTYNTNNVFFYNNIKSGYQQIASAYNNNGLTLLLTLLYFSLGVSMLVFSFRVTSGKSWLISMISIGLIALIFIFITAFLGIAGIIGDHRFNTLSCYGLLVIILFFTELCIVRNREKKGNSAVILNHIIGLLPIVPLLLLTVIVNFISQSSTDYIYDHIDYYFYLNLLLTFVTMFILIKTVVIRWKGLPED